MTAHGTFVWYELMTGDSAAAETFYKKVIGWDAKDSGMPGVNYTLFTSGETAMVAGLMAIPEDAAKMGARPGWTGYIAVDDVDATAKKVASAGGVVHKGPADIPGVGRFAIVADPQGPVFALFKPAPGSEGEPAAQDAKGHVGWRELVAKNWTTAFDFYAPIFDWTKAEAIDMGPMGVYQLYGKEGSPAMGGMMTKPDAVPAPYWLYYVNVDAIDDAIARTTEAGGKIIHGPMEVPGGAWVVQCLDPQGAMFAMAAPRR